MWIHPTLDRAISIREAARLQTFPDSFVFCGSKDKQYQQVGNAVPPIMAKAIAKPVSYTHLDVYKRQDLFGISGTNQRIERYDYGLLVAGIYQRRNAVYAVGHG